LNGAGSNWGLAVRLETDAGNEILAAALLLPDMAPPQAAHALKNVRLAAHTPGAYQFQRAATQNQIALGHFSSVLDLMALLNAEHGFLAVAMTFCNELAARHKCDRVSLGWLARHSIQLQVSSHTEKFEKKMEAVRALEQTMEEALDQDEIVVWPAAEGDTVVTRDHQLFAENQKVKFLCSVPLRVNGEPVAVVFCERNSEAFEDTEVRLLSLCAEMAARRLSELKRTDRWFGARWALAARELCAKAVGVEHTWAKVGAVAIAVVLGVLFFGGMNYRIEAPFILRTDDLAILSAPFNGYIDEVPVEIGDPVAAKAVLLKLDTRDLHLEEAAALADLDRYTREAEKARATNALAEMRIATAQAEQARVHLESVRYHLEQAAVTAPFSGVVVEGDLKKRIGAPLKQGDLLFRVARTERMYVECDVWEKDIHEVRGDAKGQIAFASQPKLKYPVKLERIEPVAQAKDQKNVFIVRCQFDCERQPWWRPGMSGVAKINVGHRTFLWILSHRTVDFLRMYFWF
jgi:biotin carboxyl carrier protein